jgi:hypothetical protein
MESVWREKTIDLGAQGDDAFGDDANIVAEAFGGNVELPPHVFAHLAHFYPQCPFYAAYFYPQCPFYAAYFYPYRLFYTAHFCPKGRFYPVDLRIEPVNLRVNPVNLGVENVDTAAKIIFDMPHIGSKGLDCFRSFDVHRSRRVILPSSHAKGMPGGARCFWVECGGKGARMQPFRGAK